MAEESFATSADRRRQFHTDVHMLYVTAWALFRELTKHRQGDSPSAALLERINELPELVASARRLGSQQELLVDFTAVSAEQPDDARELDNYGSYHEAALYEVGMFIVPLLEETGLADALPITSAVPQELLDALIGETRRYPCCPFNTPFRVELEREAGRTLKLFAAESGRQLQKGGKQSSVTRRSAARKGSAELTAKQLKIIAALTKHHKYEGDKCENLESIGVRELGRAAEVSPATVSKFFKDFFGEHAVYDATCKHRPPQLVQRLKVLNGEQSSAILRYSLHANVGRSDSGEIAE
jgi:hypothetical protein